MPLRNLKTSPSARNDGASSRLKTARLLYVRMSHVAMVVKIKNFPNKLCIPPTLLAMPNP